MQLTYVVVLLVVINSFMFCSGPGKKAGEPEQVNIKDTSVTNSAAFNQSFEKLLTAYYSLKDALVEYDTVNVNLFAKELAISADSLQVGEIQNDSSSAIAETAKNYSGTISGFARGLVGEKELDKKKREFQMISDAMYDLVRTVRYDGQKIYHQYCPMAFGDEGASWISNSSEIVNPYLGKKHAKYKNGMLHCGEITDSLQF